MFEVDFLPIERTGELGSNSGDAITMRFTEAWSGVQRVVVIDGGYSYTGESVVEHLLKWYNTGHIDLMISTHPDQDHLNGLANILDEMPVHELLIHRPHDHTADVTGFSNIAVVDALIGLAEERGVTVTEPFTGLSRFAGQLCILGPTELYYEQLVAEHLADQQSEVAAAALSASARASGILSKAANLLDRALAALPMETLGENGDPGPRNNSSVVTLVRPDNERFLFTGDAGIPAMHAAWDEYERIMGSFPDWPLDFLQAPHHGSKRNLSPSLLNRMFGGPGQNPLAPNAFISSALNDADHPSPKVTNALQRRGFNVYATESKNLVHRSDDLPPRPNYAAAIAIGPLLEDDD